MLTRIKRIRSHSGHARYLATVTDTDLVIPRQRDISSPYAYSSEWPVYRDRHGRLVVIRETSHRCFDVFLVPVSLAYYPTGGTI